MQNVSSCVIESTFILICLNKPELKPGLNLEAPIQRLIVASPGELICNDLKYLYADGDL